MTFDEFVAARQQAFLRYATVLTGNPDLAQDVLIRVHSRWSQVEAYDRPEHYVRKAILNAYVSWRRQWSVRNLVPFGSPPDRAVPEHPGSEPSELWLRMARLPRRQRAVVVLRYYEGFSDSEIAELLGCSAGTVRAHLSKALAKLRADLRNHSFLEAL